LKKVSNKIHFVIETHRNLLRSTKVKVVNSPVSLGMFLVNELLNRSKDAAQNKEIDGQARNERHADKAKKRMKWMYRQTNERHPKTAIWFLLLDGKW
jgi:hypothetical protein